MHREHLGGVAVITKEADARFLRGILFALILATLATGLLATIATTTRAGSSSMSVATYGL